MVLGVQKCTRVRTSRMYLSCSLCCYCACRVTSQDNPPVPMISNEMMEQNQGLRGTASGFLGHTHAKHPQFPW